VNYNGLACKDVEDRPTYAISSYVVPLCHQSGAIEIGAGRFRMVAVM